MSPEITSLARQVLTDFRERGLRVATAESCTGGLVAGALTEIPGSSDVVECGFVTYSNRAKVRTLSVDDSLIAEFGAVSEQVAAAMAIGALAHSFADIAVATTGVAGPGGSEAKPEGLVCFAVARSGEPAIAQTVRFGAIGRHAVREASVLFALELLHGSIESKS
jgi:nicotinamide-nucleotide amidase